MTNIHLNFVCCVGISVLAASKLGHSQSYILMLTGILLSKYKAPVQLAAAFAAEFFFLKVHN